MNDQHLTPSLLTFADEERSPLSIRAKALVFIDPRSRQLRDDVDRLARLPIALLIRGESGTGKELLARYVHRESERGGLFVAVSCSAISTTAADAELFGYAAGAHAAALSSRAGWFGSANGGTLYLDEIGDLPLSLQSKLLTALETGEAWRVGATRATPVDVRLVAATSIDLSQAVAAGKFNERLYHYLSDGRVDLLPLRERIGDILPLAEYFLGVYAQRLSLPLPQVGLAAQRLLETHAWPGNTRELENVIHFALLVSQGEELLPVHFNFRDPFAQLEADLLRLVGNADAQQRSALSRLLQQAARQLEEVSPA
ncbi:MULTISPECIES: sigma 54-interacting transcriptional regulator [Stutzerimonas stutzeri subgroup]|jgi:transcriptional regulator with AAA-type ATPase domain|uniref:Sigma-54-binding protein n=1 Tax=Stutzerimonas stutzeri NF13 TaxID=1212548 RepID=M2UPW1_STUST|nr:MULTISPECIES: sigma 54-interacting transcriptional regulator [Stutzerimonas stutzeri subgroup]EME00655.1 sigma-54-binding protein [Stutzerimonas stutzeri NF13]MBK3880178.1 sigma-54-dependent Fis family transcriptional regulator [Stutzerimonas stutzeri]MCQ4293396.1 sigma 54-interacting transcriptional regulator [Stutzerimonas stutzeri]WOF78133.1 sigma 54-interacting transcriptional regulator [Pseudomonas sp. FeN3W]